MLFTIVSCLFNDTGFGDRQSGAQRKRAVTLVEVVITGATGLQFLELRKRITKEFNIVPEAAIASA